MRGYTLAEVAAGDAARVVAASCPVVLGVCGGSASAVIGVMLFEASVVGGAGAFGDHGLDGCVRAGRLGLDASLGVVARSLSIVVLEKTWVADVVGSRRIGGADADAAVGLLHDSHEEETGIETRCLGSILDSGLDGVGLSLGVRCGASQAVLARERAVQGPAVKH